MKYVLKLKRLKSLVSLSHGCIEFNDREFPLHGAPIYPHDHGLNRERPVGTNQSNCASLEWESDSDATQYTD